ncbi:MAG: hypothetical protein QNK30_02335, partial [Bacteroidales bacterium]|nr:hypothetical protein [Bacteroidales bacterium]
MGNIKEIQDSIAGLRETNKSRKDELRITNAKLENTEAQISSFKPTGTDSDEQLNKLKEARDVLKGKKTMFQSELAANNTEIKDINDLIREQYNPVEDIEQLEDSYPLLLFPLRLETRFKKTDNQDQLWIRVYPDDCNVLKKEPLFSEDELTDVIIFWSEMTKAAGIETDERGAWTVLVNSHGTSRATWMINKYKPLIEIAERPDDTFNVLALVTENENTDALLPAIQTYWKEMWFAQGDEEKITAAENKLNTSGLTNTEIEKQLADITPYNISDPMDAAFDPAKILISKLCLPKPGNFVTTKTSWNEAPQAVSLPDKFVAITHSGETKKSFPFENAVNEYLPVGFDPTSDDGSITKNEVNKDIQVNEELKWMVDFNEAVKAGMATRIDLSSDEALNGFDQLFVVGLRITSNAQTSKQELEGLITTHKESKQGFEFIKQGTPTNNTEDNPSGYSWQEDADESYDRIFKDSENFTVTSNVAEQSDAQLFADSLQIDPAILQGLQNANGHDQSEAKAMNLALFPATMGYFMEEMMDPLFSDQDISDTWSFFGNFISGRGPVPAIKIGRQPYGILPVTRFSTLNFPEVNNDSPLLGKKTYPSRLYSLIKKIDETWDTLVSQVKYIGRNGDPHQVLLDILSLHANSIEFHQRYAQSIQQVYNQMNLALGSPVIAGLIAAAVQTRGKLILQELGIYTEKLKLPILEKYFLSTPNKLNGPLIDDVPESETKPIRNYSADGKNYIEWLRQVDGEKIRRQDFGGENAPTALLYLLLRHSVQLTQSNSATNFLLGHDLLSSKMEFFDTNFLYIQSEETGKSKFEHLYNTYDSITGNQSVNLMQHIYKPDVLSTSPETQALRNVLDALSSLEKTPTARLDRLLTEHFDCCSYRLDSWKTGLTYYQLGEQKKYAEQNQKEKGIYLGAYGWLLDLRPKQTNLNEVNLDTQDKEFFTPNGQKIYADPDNLGYIHAPSVDQAGTAAILRNAYDSNKESGTSNPFAINLTSERIRIANDFLEGIRNGQPLSALLGYQFERGLHDLYVSSGIEADKFIYPLRIVFPLVSNHLASTQTTTDDINEANTSNNTTDTSIEAIEARNVIDGLKLIQHVQHSSDKTYPFGLTASHNLPSANTTEAAAITEEVNRLIDINDAIADLVMTEQVFQAVKGNFDRAAGVANAFSKGSYPPEMEVINTPRTGLALTHKMAIHFDAEASPMVSPNTVTGMTPRAGAEPSINAWLSGILPPPDRIQVKVKVKEPGKAEQSIIISQKDLGLQSIDLLFSAASDNDQAMSELDDRIVNYLIYKYKDPDTNAFLNPFTEISILYTEEIDSADRTKVSFFELGSMLQSLKKLLVSKPFLNHSALQLPTEDNETIDVTYDVTDFTDRINKLKNDLDLKNTEIKNILNQIKSIQYFSEQHETKLTTAGLDESKIASLNETLSDDLKNYLSNTSATLKTDLMNTYKKALVDMGISSAIIASLKTDYDGYLTAYVNDFSNLAALVKNTCDKFMAVALFDNNQTGTGFIHQALGNVFDNTVKKLEVVIDRWRRNETEYNSIMAEYDPITQTNEQLIQILQAAERKVASSNTSPVPTVPATYKTSVEAKKLAFDGVLGELQSILSNNFIDVNVFYTQTNAILNKMGAHDNTSFDTENVRNDLYEILQILISLREDIYTAVSDLQSNIDKKFSDYTEESSGYELLAADTDKIDKLLAACKKILKDEITLLPKLTFAAELGEAVRLAYNKSEGIQDFSRNIQGREFPVDDWFSGIARVRNNAWEFENVMSLTQGFNPGKAPNLKPLQFPVRENDRWLALKYIKEETDPVYVEDEENVFKELQGDSLLYTAHFATNFDKTKPICGIIIDEWTEVVPAKEETTGIAFHYDQPGSEPPQTMLLLTPPAFTGKWLWDDLIGTLEETLSMAKKRAVEPSMIDGTTFSQFLPTTLMAVATNWITVATNLSVNNTPVDAN